jgi:hypothetical protein
MGERGGSACFQRLWDASESVSIVLVLVVVLVLVLDFTKWRPITVHPHFFPPLIPLITSYTSW